MESAGIESVVDRKGGLEGVVGEISGSGLFLGDRGGEEGITAASVCGLIFAVCDTITFLPSIAVVEYFCPWCRSCRGSSSGVVWARKGAAEVGFVECAILGCECAVDSCLVLLPSM